MEQIKRNLNINNKDKQSSVFESLSKLKFNKIILSHDQMSKLCGRLYNTLSIPGKDYDFEAGP